MIDFLPNKLPEIVPSKDRPFAGDRLSRSQYAQSLRSIINAYSITGCVLSINGDWGTGKTTFIKMWQEYLNHFHYRTIYFNAWETDYIEDPLVALLGELKGLLVDKEQIRKICGIFGKLSVAAGKLILKHTTGIDVDDIAEVIKGQIDEYSEQKTAFEEFKQLLIEYVSFVDEEIQMPVIFIIDELDRCNPHFAVKVLERVKHLFDIPNIIFVLPICKSQLEYSIQGFYGSDKIDAANYLRRFIDLEFELPKPDYSQFFQFLFEHHIFEQFFKTNNIPGQEDNHIKLFENIVVKLCSHMNTDLRTMDKLFVLCRLVATEMHVGNKREMDLIFLLCFIKLHFHELYCDIRDHKLLLQDLINQVEEKFPRQLITQGDDFNNDYHTFLYVVAELLYVYNQNRGCILEDNVLPSLDSSDLNLELKVIDREKLLAGLRYVSDNGYRWENIRELTDKIDLLRIN